MIFQSSFKIEDFVWISTNTNALNLITFNGIAPHPPLSPAFAEAASRRQASGERGG